MNTLSILAVLTGLFVRIVLPLGVTALIAYGLHRLDERWQAEAKLENERLANHESPCWKEQGLSVEQMKLSESLGGRPCWQARRSHNGYLREECLDCELFRSAPASPSHSRAHTFKV